MATIVTRSGKGSALTHTEADANFTNLNSGKLETNATAASASALVTGNSYQVASLGVGTAASGTTGEIRATNNVTAYYSSDALLKENIRSITNATDICIGVGGKIFDWRDSYIQSRGGEDGYFIRKEDFGVIAQDVLKYFPLAVRTRQDGTLAVDYEKLCSIAFQAILELDSRIKQLEQKND